MSQQVVITDTIVAYPSGLDSTNSVYDSASNIETGYNPATNTSYAQFNATKGANAETWVYYTFTPNLPNGATITGISCEAKSYITNTRAFSVRTIQLYTGTTAKGSSEALTTISETFSFTETVSDWTVSELNNIRVVLHAVRGTSNTSTDYYVRFFGATLTIGYTFEGVAYEITSSSNIPNTKGVSISPEYQLQPSAASITITNEDGLNLRVIDTYGASKTTQTFNDTSYTYTLNNLNNDHNVVVDYNTTNYSKINNQWRPIVGVYQKSSGVWSATTFNSAFPSGTMIKQGNDIGDEVPLVKFLSNCDVIYLDGYGDDTDSARISRRYRASDDINLDEQTCYVLVFCYGSFGLHKVEFHIPSDAQATTTSTSLFEYGATGTKLYVYNGRNNDRGTYLYQSTNGTTGLYVYNGTMVTLKLKDNISSTGAQQLENLISTSSNILGSYGFDSASTGYVWSSTLDNYLPCYILAASSTNFGLSKVTANKTITSILGYTTSNTITNRGMTGIYNNNIYYSGPTSTTRTSVSGGGSLICV